MKRVEELAPADFMTHPVWEFGDDFHEMDVTPVRDLPVTSLRGRIAGTRLTLHNGSQVWGMLGNASLSSVRSNEQFLAVSVEKDGEWFHLARYHDVDYERRGPAQLAAFLGLSIDEVFPISYDISGVAAGSPETVAGLIPSEPPERLSLDELIDLSLEEDE